MKRRPERKGVPRRIVADVFRCVSFFCAVAVTAAAEPYRVALLTDPSTPWGPATGLAATLRTKGFEVATLTAAHVADSQTFSAATCDCLIIPKRPRLSSSAGASLLAFVKKGGDLVLLGGLVFGEPTAGVEESLRLEAFDDNPVYVLRDVCAITSRPQQDWLAGQLDLRGTFTGLSAVGFPALGDATYVPLLGAEDRYGRTRGWAAGMLLHHAGPFAGSQWLLFGVKEEAFYAQPSVIEMTAQVLTSFRDGKWLARSQSESDSEAQKTIAPRAPTPVPLRIEGAHFVRPGGSRFFALGANFFNSFHTYYGGGKQWNATELERDFQRMRRAGINAIRLHDAQRFLVVGRTETFLGLCRQYGIYILPTAAAAHSGKSLEQLASEARRKAALLKDEPMMLGYDLDNEPYWWELARLTLQGQKLSARYPVPKDAWKEYQHSLALAPADWTTTFPGLERQLPEPQKETWRQAFESVSGIFGAWTDALANGIRAEDKVHPISVGYNTVYGCLPVNQRLDFIAHHVYEPPTDLEHVRINLTTMDRLRKIWPGKSILLGEFGYSNGDLVDGACLDVYASSVGEMAHYLHALAGGFDGVLKWELCDPDPAYQWRSLTWQRDKPKAEQLQQRRFGMFYFDGTPEGNAKPIAHATRFLRDYLDSHALQGKLTLRPADYPTGTAYTFTADHALFVGDRRYESEGLRFESADPANVMLMWDVHALHVMSTADARITLRPSFFVASLTPDTQVSGIHGETVKSQKEGWVTVTALEGEALTFSVSY